jgi:RNA polymerase sigma-70 factor, ECF subfamily
VFSRMPFTNMAENPTQFAATKIPGDDLGLVHASKKGNVTAFEQLVKRYDRRLLRISFRVTRNREDSEDAVQEALLKAFQNLAEFREDSQFSTWLISITVNQSLMKLRKRTNKEISLDQDVESDGNVLPVDVPDRGPNPEQLCWASELRDIFVKTLEELRPILRTVFILRDVEGLTINQTAEVLSVSQEAVKARLWRVRLELRERLTKYFRERPDSPRRQAWSREKGTRRILRICAECLRSSISQTYSIGHGQLAAHALPTTEPTEIFGAISPRSVRPI